jgi:hypothetical protein
MTSCVDTMVDNLKYYFGDGYEPADHERVLHGEWITRNSSLIFSDFVIDQINRELNSHGVVGVYLENDMDGRTYDHAFVLVKIGNKIYRKESYIFMYCNRTLNLGPLWSANLKALIDANPGATRLSLWNRMFSANERRDTLTTPVGVFLYSKC